MEFGNIMTWVDINDRPPKNNVLCLVARNDNFDIHILMATRNDDGWIVTMPTVPKQRVDCVTHWAEIVYPEID